MSKSRKSLDERFDEKWIPDPNSGCYLWLGAISPGKKGLGGVRKHPYGIFNVNGKLKMSHRFSYERERGEIPKGMFLDHKCRTTLCVNPEHLEPVTPKENTNRGVRYSSTLTHCPKGHEYAGENLYTTPQGYRGCRTCRKENWRAWAIQNGRNVRT